MVDQLATLNMDSLIKYYGITSRQTGVTKLDPGDFVITRGGFLGRIRPATGAITDHLSYLAYDIAKQYDPILVHTNNKKNFGIAVGREPRFDIVYVIPRGEWPSLYKCDNVDDARVHLDKFSENPDMQTLIGSKLTYAAVARHYNPKASIPIITGGSFREEVSNPSDIKRLPFQNVGDAWAEINRRAGHVQTQPKPETEPAPQIVPQPVTEMPEPPAPERPQGAHIERMSGGGFVRTITHYVISGDMQFGDNNVTVKAVGGDIHVKADGGAMSADELAVMIHELQKVLDAVDGS